MTVSSPSAATTVTLTPRLITMVPPVGVSPLSSTSSPSNRTTPALVRISSTFGCVADTVVVLSPSTTNTSYTGEAAAKAVTEKRKQTESAIRKALFNGGTAISSPILLFDINFSSVTALRKGISRCRACRSGDARARPRRRRRTPRSRGQADTRRTARRRASRHRASYS